MDPGSVHRWDIYSSICLHIYLLSIYLSTHLFIIHPFFFFYTNICSSTGWSKKSLSCDLEEKRLRNSKIFFDGVFLSIYSHLLKKLELSKLCKKKLWDSKNPENCMFQKSHLIKKETYFFDLFLFLLQDISYSSLVLKFQVSK